MYMVVFKNVGKIKEIHANMIVFACVKSLCTQVRHVKLLLKILLQQLRIVHKFIERQKSLSVLFKKKLLRLVFEPTMFLSIIH